jgi:hypothetical protein
MSILLRSWLFVKVIFGISGKIKNALVTHLPAGRQGLNIDDTEDEDLLFDLNHFGHFSSLSSTLATSASG